MSGLAIFWGCHGYLPPQFGNENSLTVPKLSLGAIRAIGLTTKGRKISKTERSIAIRSNRLRIE
ncbi:hypothetical protein RMSM_02726 [Rhodopirellula maiorica SM1]|uniref:Uncharacterized protein n=1 Tax=Rhodopirellula maiorica SM1 TaxID=1265738 RepID=M5RM08_9BACT|nr:hypothetical protein RMSM_02726 [Rhodopirellula maiorica SM1]